MDAGANQQILSAVFARFTVDMNGGCRWQIVPRILLASNTSPSTRASSKLLVMDCLPPGGSTLALEPKIDVTFHFSVTAHLRVLTGGAAGVDAPCPILT